ncbi:MAG: hypothetical protein WD011_00555 [Nitriliruptoraceae bacterium]
MARFLVVSDDADERRRAANAVTLIEGAVVETAATADELRNALLQPDHSFDVAIVDGDLHPRGGYAALYDIRARCELEGRAAIPTVILGSRETDAWLSRWAGASAFICKPVDAFTLSATAERIIGTQPPPYGDAGAASAQVAAATRDHQE